MRRCKKYLALLLSVVCLMAMGLTVFAAEPTAPANQVPTETRSGDDGDYGIMPASIYGYAADYTDNTVDSFTVSAPGSATATGSATIKTSDFGSSTQIVYVNIYRPDGSLAKGDIKMTGNMEKVVSFTNAQSGTYTVSYSVYGNYKGWIHCWIY